MSGPGKCFAISQGWTARVILKQMGVRISFELVSKVLQSFFFVGQSSNLSFRPLE